MKNGPNAKPCPFCGKLANHIGIIPDGKGKRVACEHCVNDKDDVVDHMNGASDPFWREAAKYEGGYCD